jgi:CubicO group peptidase (beta-lactamase class C family)
MRSALCPVTLVTAVLLASVPAPAADDVAASGRGDPRLRSFDKLMTEFVRDHQIPGAALAVSYHGRLVYARGFGFADVERKQPVQPGSLFRIASVTKPITAVAVMKLVGGKKLRVDDRVVDVLRLRQQLDGMKGADARWKDITILHLLQHTAGFDRDKSFDPMFRPIDIARSLQEMPPAGADAIIRYMLSKPLDFTPGERHAYSNFGYCLLGRVIEAVSGKNYETYVRENILRLVGVEATRQGHTLIDGRLPGEVHYYDGQNRTTRAVVGPPDRVPLPYGGFYLEAMDSHGGWVASAPDLVRFAAAFDVPARCPVLSTREIATMFARPAGAAGFDKDGKPKDAYYACGWMVRPVGRSGRANTWHAGSLDGTATLLVRRHDGLDWAVLFNTRHDPAGGSLTDKIDGALHGAADAVRSWPEWNLFPVSVPRE